MGDLSSAFNYLENCFDDRMLIFSGRILRGLAGKKNGSQTCKHSLRAVPLASLIYDWFDLEEDRGLFLFSVLNHDAGKLMVPSDVLGKIGGFNNRDREKMGVHAYESSRILRGAGFYEAAEVVRYHHGNEDGGFDGTHPLCEYVALADVWDASLSRCDKFSGLSPIEKMRVSLPGSGDKINLIESRGGFSLAA